MASGGEAAFIAARGQGRGVITDRVGWAQSRIAASGGSAPVTLVAVTKGFGPESVVAALRAGVADIGENYAQELVAKAAAVSSVTDHFDTEIVPRWHFLGAVQTNK